ncbi:MAG: hypothetical protein OEX12_08665 [Gammaproteobacteria bacterium]|nr:hypothetical protein [Gammaproteobacteria bacterium]
MDGNKDSSRDSIQRFWDRYIFSLGNLGIKPEVQRWYVRRAEQYIKHYSDKRLVDHSADDLTECLTMLGRQNGLEDWQFTQIVDAIRTLLCHLVRPEWCNSFDWSYWKDASKQLSPHHATLARESRVNSLSQLQHREDKALL